MNRKDFLKKGLLGATVFGSAPHLSRLVENKVDELNPLKVVGYNHLPNSNETVSDNIIIHRAHSRGTADHGWLKANFSFSFANYHNPERMHFGVLRVLNDDTIGAGRGFRTHPHDNMEIITIPLKGTLEHKDSMGNTSQIKAGEIQVMSAGTGIRHSEFATTTEDVQSFQIWLFPKYKDVTPRYDQLRLDPVKRKNAFQQILSPNQNDEGVWIHQDAWFHMADIDQGKNLEYKCKRNGNGMYIMVVDGSASILGHTLNKRDAMGIWDVNSIAVKSENPSTQILVLDVPMTLG